MENISLGEMNLIKEDKVYNRQVTITSKDESKTIDLELNESLEYDTLIAIADKISDAVVSNGIYSPENKKPLFLFYVLNNMTNIKPKVDEEGNIDLNDIFKLMKSPIGKEIEDLTVTVPTLWELDYLIDDKIEFKKQEMLHNKKSSMDEAFESLNTLLLSLNEKAKELDVKKLEKIIKKLNPKELVKAYEESNIGNNMRDKTIQEQAKEIKELKKQNGARNVVSDMKVVK